MFFLSSPFTLFPRIVVVLYDRISIFTFSKNPTELHRIETTPNPYGTCVLCPNNNNSLLAFPGTEIGHVSLIDLANMRRAPVDILAHEATVTCLAFNLQGSRLATASEKVRILFTSFCVRFLSFPMA